MDHLPPLFPTLAGALVVYVLWVHSVRYNRINNLHSTYAARYNLTTPPPLHRTNGKAPTRAGLPMTPAEAQKILQMGLTSDLPFLGAKALEFALFKTYGIPSISAVLKGTSEFEASDKAGRRYVDTSLLVVSFVAYPIVGPGSGASESAEKAPVDPRNAISVARMNYHHSRYKSKITNADLLYTLSTFILEPAVWAKAFEWRELSPLEEQAWFVFFSETGRRMGITQIPEELQDLIDWAEVYEVDSMVPDTGCRDIAEATILLLLHNVPSFLRPLGREIVSSLLAPRLRAAVMLPEPPALLQSSIRLALHARAFLVRHFFLPRSEKDLVGLLDMHSPAFPEGYIPLSQALPNEQTDPAAEAPKEETYAPRVHPKFYANEAWYMPLPTGLGAVVQSVLLNFGLQRPNQVPGSAYKPQGFRLEEVGPVKYENTGAEEVRKEAERLQGAPVEGPYAVGGAPKARCPHTFGAK